MDMDSVQEPIAAVKKYLDFVRQQTANPSPDPWQAAQHDSRFAVLNKPFQKLFCTPATSAPVERVFSHSGLFMRPHRARLGDKILSDLVFMKCNSHV